MRSNPIPMIIFLFSLVLIFDLYIFKALRMFFSDTSQKTRLLIYLIHWLIPIIFYGAFLFLAFRPQTIQTAEGFSKFYFVVGFFVLFYVPKLTFIIFHLIEDLLRLSAFIARKLSTETSLSSLRDIQWLSKTGAILASIIFISIIYGIVYGRFNFTVKEQNLRFANLPKSFDGLRIVQFSDMHIGSFYGHEKQIEKAVDLINAQNADIVLFTGDMVNNLADELEHFVPILQKINPPMGKFSILGNHDYSDYHNWESAQAKADNLSKLKLLHKKAGFELLLNAAKIIRKNNDEITILGVENWGVPPFPQYGNLQKTLESAADVPFKILLSHDPSHWRAEILEKTDVDLTLSGHTHAFQFAFRLGNFMWSPVSFRYPEWRGIYFENNQYLYVNIGLGFIAFPGRVGSPPEITVFNLKRASE